MLGLHPCGTPVKLALVASLLLAGHQARAETWPSRAVHIIVGFAAGGGTDTSARLIAPRLSAIWGQPVVVENRDGAGGSIAASVVAEAKPDGYLLAMVSSAHTITPNQIKLSYDAVKSFAPVTEVASVPDFLLVNPALPVHSVPELIALARAKPGTLNYGSVGAGTPPHLAMVLFQSLTGTDMVHVPFKGGAPALTALLSNEVQLEFGAVSTTLAQVRAGKLRALAVSSGVRMPSAPEFPTIAEAANLPGFDVGVWYGLLAPAGTPPAITEKISDDIAVVLQQPEVHDRMGELGLIGVGDSPAHFTATIQSNIARWSKVLAQTTPQ